MKNMALLIDTNVVLDFFLDREPFVGQAEKIIKYCIYGNVRGYLAAHSLLNIFYIARNQKTVEERNLFLLMLCKKFSVIGVDREMIIDVLRNGNWRDLEDGLQMQCAAVENLDYIITRDTRGFEMSKVQVISPEEVIKMLEG